MKQFERITVRANGITRTFPVEVLSEQLNTVMVRRVDSEGQFFAKRVDGQWVQQQELIGKEFVVLRRPMRVDPTYGELVLT